MLPCCWLIPVDCVLRQQLWPKLLWLRFIKLFLRFDEIPDLQWRVLQSRRCQLWFCHAYYRPFIGLGGYHCRDSEVLQEKKGSSVPNRSPDCRENHHASECDCSVDVSTSVIQLRSLRCWDLCSSSGEPRPGQHHNE